MSLQSIELAGHQNINGFQSKSTECKEFIHGPNHILNNRPIPNCRPGCKDDQNLIKDLYQMRTTRMHFSQKLISDPGLLFGSKEYLNSRRALDFNGVYEIIDYMIHPEHQEIRIVDKEIPRPNGITLSPDGSRLYVTETCSTIQLSNCTTNMTRINQYDIDLGNSSAIPQKIGTMQFNVNGSNPADGLAIHPDTGLLVASCPNGICIIKSSSQASDGQLIANIMLGEDPPPAVSNVAFGRKYMYLTGAKHVWRIPLVRL